MYKIPILTSNLDHMNFVWECLDIRYGLFDTKRGFYQFAAKANVSGSGCPGSNFIQVKNSAETIPEKGVETSDTKNSNRCVETRVDKTGSLYITNTVLGEANTNTLLNVYSGVQHIYLSCFLE